MRYCLLPLPAQAGVGEGEQEELLDGVAQCRLERGALLRVAEERGGEEG